ncbi:hypothetical protein ACFSUS_08035 [Spirosoma soli]|uniref:Uncharacterized protein n=1 Tax=Spirosoma soli TaxID=1770529 RepID=A0ABW5M4F2_9BACT
MERTIITRQNVRRSTIQPNSEAPALPEKVDSYQAQFLKLVPVEVISAYITIDGLLRGSVLPQDSPGLYVGLLWGVFVTLAIVNPLYLRHVTKVKDQRQISLSAGAFVIYVVSLGGPFAHFGLDEAVIRLLGSILIPIYTLIALIVLNK